MTRKSRPFWNRLTQAMTVQAVKADAPHSLRPTSAVRPLALEQRFMFDGAGAADAAHAVADGASHGADAVDGAHAFALALQMVPQAVEVRAANPALDGGKKEVVLVDTSLADYQTLVAGVRQGVGIVEFDGSKDGLVQIAVWAKTQAGYDAIHILSHGTPGVLELGSAHLNSAALGSAEIQAELAQLGQALTADGDLMLYGCDVAQGNNGQAFLNELAALTGADVAASTDRTGAAALGGNWTLEAHTGSIETARPWAADGGPDYADLLALPGTNQQLGNTYWSNNTGGNTVDGFTLSESTGATRASSSNSIYYNTGVVADSSSNYYYELTWTADNVDLGKFDLDAMQIQSFGGSYRLDFSAISGGVAVSQTFTITGAQGPLTIDIDNTRFNDISAFTVRVTNLSGATSVANIDLQKVILADLKGPNADPVLGGLNGKTASYTEDSAPTLIDATGTATVSDADSANFDGGQLRVTIASGLHSLEDVLGIRNQGTGAGQIGVSGSNVTYGGVVIGSFTGGSAGTDLLVTFNTSADAAAVQAVARNLTYLNSNGFNPSTALRTLNVSVTDGDGGTSATASVALSVIATNDAPVLSPANNSVGYTENGISVSLQPGLSLVDDGDSFLSATVTISDFRSGDFLSVGTLNGFSATFDSTTGVLTFSGSGTAASLQAVLRSVSYSSLSDDPTFGGTDSTRQINFTVTDSSGAISNTASAQVAITAVNDAPTLSDGPYSWAGTNEDTTSAAVSVGSLLGSLSHADVDGPASGIALTGLTGNGVWQYSTDGVSWTDVGSVSGTSALLLSSASQLRYVPDAGNGETATLSFRAWDQSSGSASNNGIRSTADTSSNGGSSAFSSGVAQASLNVSSVNDAPVLTAIQPTLPGLTDSQVNNVGQTVGALTSGAISDVDLNALAGIAVTGLNPGNGTWQYSLDGGTSWQSVGVVSTGNALLLRSTDRVRFVPDGVNGTIATLTYHAWDQSGATAGAQGTRVDASQVGGTSPFSSGTDTASVTVTAVNDAPVLSASGGSAAFVEGDNVASTPVVIDAGLVVTDSDSPTLLSAQVKITGGFKVSEDVLGFTGVSAITGDIVGVYNMSTGILTLTSAGGASIAQWQAALRSVTYSNTSDTPDGTPRTVSFSVNDGQLDSNAVSRSVTVTATNDAPILSLPGVINFNEDSIGAITGITVADADAGTNNVQITFILANGGGSLNAMVSGTVAVGTSANTVTLTGKVADINAYLASGNLRYVPALNLNGDVSLSVSVSDLGNSGGTAKFDSGSLTLHVDAVNDPASITYPSTITVVEDVAEPLTGITFGDVDAGSGSLTVRFSVPTGTLSALSGSGVTVSGSGSGLLTLNGTLADLNSFIAQGSVSYLTAANATANVALNVSIDDNGNTGSGGNKVTSVTLTLAVVAVNDAPVNVVPAAQEVPENGALTFSVGNGNLISISDVDAGAGNVRVTLTVNHGLITLSSISGLSFLTGSGANDGIVSFEGSIADINNALAGLTFTPSSGYHGSASLQITTNDLGLSGSGGAMSDTDTISIDVIQPHPKVTGVVAAPGSDGQHKVGDQIDIVVNFDNAIIVDQTSGSPTLLLETGAIDRQAQYLSGSGTNQLTFRYTVQVGDLSADLDYASTSALSLNGAVLQSAQGFSAILTLPTVGSASSLAGQQAIVVDGIVPTISSVQVPGDASYRLGQNLDFTVNFSEAVTVDSTGGTPRLAVTLDTGGTVYADYLSGSGGSALVFRLTVASGQLDTDGIRVAGNVQLNGGSIRDVAGNDSTRGFIAPSTSGILVDGVVPTVADVIVPANGGYKAGDVLSFTVNTSETVFASGSPRLALDVGGTTRYATLVAGSSSGSTLVFQYTVQAGDSDSDGISVASNLDLNGGSVKDAAGNDLTLALNSIGSTAAVVVDTVAPSVTSIVRAGGSPSNSGSISYTVSFSEDISGVDISDFTATFDGTSAGNLASVTQVDGRTYTVVIDNLSGAGDVTLSLKSSGTGIVDAANNAVTGGLPGETYTIDRVAPAVTSVSVPSNGTYVAGQDLDFTVHLGEATIVDTSGGSPRIEVTLDNGQTAWANYVSGTGSNALVFRVTVANGQLDTNGVTVGSTIQLNGATLRDAIGNDANVNLNSVGDTNGVKVDAVVPQVSSVDLPANGSYKAGDVLSFTVNTSEGVVIDAVGGTPRLVLTVGGVTRYANYVSGGADDALVFQYTVQSGDTASGGIVVNGTLDLNGGHVNDPAGNALNLNLGAVGNTGGVLVDTTTPYATSITRVDATPNNSGSVSYTVTFSENVGNVDTSDFNLFFGGSVVGAIESVTAVDGQTFTVKVSGLTGTGTVRLDLKQGTDIADAAGNQVPGGRVGVNYSIDRDAPSVTSVDVPANGTYVAGQNLDFTVHLSENVQLNTSGGSPRLEVLLDNGQTAWADYVSGAGTSALVFSLTVADGQLDTNGITVSNTIQLNGATLRDSVGNDAQLALNSLPPTNGVLVDAVAPVVTSVRSPVDGRYNAGDVLVFSVHASESLLVSGSPRLVLDVGAVTRYATLVYGNNSSTLVFEYTVQAGDNDANGISVSGSLDLNGGAVRDAAGNDLVLTLNGLGTTSGVIVDTVRPTVTIVVANSALKVGETTLVTIAFSEAVSGLTTADFSIEHGVLSNLVSSDGGITWTATLTPTAGITNTSNVITLNNAGYADAAGNSGTGTTASNVYAIDTLGPVAPEMTLDQATLVEGRQVSPTGLVIISGLEAGGSWQYSLDNGASWLEGRGNSVQLPGLGAFKLLVQQRDGAGNVSLVTSLNAVVEPLVPPTAPPPGLPVMMDLPTGLGLAPFQASEVSEPSADFLQSTSAPFNTSSQPGGMQGSGHWSGYGVAQSIAGINDWMGVSFFAPSEVIRSGFDAVPAQFSVSTGVSILDLKPVLLTSDSPWDIASLRFSFTDRQELPAWVRLDRQTGQLTIHAFKDFSTTLVLQIKVSDGKGHESVRTIKVVIGDARAASSTPAGRAGLSEKMANAANQQAGKRMSMYVHG